LNNAIGGNYNPREDNYQEERECERAMPLDNAGPFLTDPNSQEHRLPAQTATIGRAMECDIVIASKSISRENTRLRREGRR
jgi:hypothetical protein